MRNRSSTMQCAIAQKPSSAISMPCVLFGVIQTSQSSPFPFLTHSFLSTGKWTGSTDSGSLQIVPKGEGQPVENKYIDNKFYMYKKLFYDCTISNSTFSPLVKSFQISEEMSPKFRRFDVSCEFENFMVSAVAAQDAFAVTDPTGTRGGDKVKCSSQRQTGSDLVGPIYVQETLSIRCPLRGRSVWGALISVLMVIDTPTWIP